MHVPGGVQQESRAAIFAESGGRNTYIFPLMRFEWQLSNIVILGCFNWICCEIDS